jgi:hypothetical protein
LSPPIYRRFRSNWLSTMQPFRALRISYVPRTTFASFKPLRAFATNQTPGSAHQSASAKSPNVEDLKRESQERGAAMSASAMHNQGSSTDREASKLKSQETPTQHADKTKLQSPSSPLSSDHDMSSANRPTGSSGLGAATSNTKTGMSDPSSSSRHNEPAPSLSPMEHAQHQQFDSAHPKVAGAGVGAGSGSGAGAGMARTSDSAGKDRDQNQHQQHQQYQQHVQQQQAKPKSSEHDSAEQRDKKSGIEYR